MKLVFTTIALFAFYTINTWGVSGSPKCGQVLLNKGKSTGKDGSTLEGHWPWLVAIYQQRIPQQNPRYSCGGTLVSKRHVITTPAYLPKKLNEWIYGSKVTVHLGKHSIEDSGEKVQIGVVKRIRTCPENSTIFQIHLAILELEDPVTFTKWVQPACLWCESDIDLKNIIGQSGSVATWTFNGTTGELIEEQKLLDMPVISRNKCFRAYPEVYAQLTPKMTYCADGKQICSGSNGEGMVFEKNGSWYLRGVAIMTLAKPNVYDICDPYVVFADVAQVLPWIKSNIK